MESSGGVSRRTFLALGAAVVVGACSGDDGAGPAGTSAPTSPPPSPATTPPSSTPTSTSPPPTSPPSTTPAPTTTEPAPSTTEPGPAEYTGAADPFTLGVASGDPTADSVVLWTRLVPDPESGGGLDAEDDVYAVRWEVATDDGFTDVVRAGTFTTDPAAGQSVHVDAAGLEPGTWYSYRFVTGPHTSPVGRTRTMPADADVPAEFRLGAASCQNYEDGFYAAHRDIAGAGLDAVVWLGDYIYEGAAGTVGEGGNVRSHGTPEPVDLAGYRARYSLYKSDPDLQAAHAACPWFVIWDDHEVENNYAGRTAQLVTGAAVPEAEFLARRRQAYQAWWEHQPVRLPAPAGDEYPIHRQARIGGLAELTMLDGRQFRSDQACGDVTLSMEPACPEAFDDSRTMLGADQEAWFASVIGATGAPWTVLANQVVLSNLILGGAVLNYDQWDGYPAARDRLLRAVVDAGVVNFVVLTGDIHFAGVGDLRGPGPDPAPPVIGAEFVTTSISSAGNVDPSVAGLKDLFPDIVDLELLSRGWTMHTITPTEWTAEYRIVADASTAGSAVGTYRTFTVRAGTAGVVRPG